MSGTLFVVATPIGNLEDVTLRALRILREADIVLCEDTRVTKKLLDAYDIKKPLLSYHAQSGVMKEEKILALLGEGKTLALVSDSGTPGISDPGSRLVSAIGRRFGGEARVVPIPGPSALTSSLSAAGVSASEFLFLGFLPHKKGRKKLFDEIGVAKRTVVFYESPHRIMKTLETLGGDESGSARKRVVIARELTKIYEEIAQGTPAELYRYFVAHPDKVRGEFVVIVCA